MFEKSKFIVSLAISIYNYSLFYFMAGFNTYDYQFLIKCLSEGSLAFKSQSIKRLTMLAQNDKKQFSANSKNILNAMQELYSQQRDDINIQCTLLLSEILINTPVKENQNLIKSKHLKHLICNLGHASKPTIRKASHTSLLAFLKTYHNFDNMLEEYLDSGFQNENNLIIQKSINSFQSIFILEVKYFSWNTENAKRLLQSMINKAGSENIQIAKASAQCLLSLCKNQNIKQTTNMISLGYLQKFYDFLCTTQQKLPNADLKINKLDVNQLIQSQRLKQKPQIIQKHEQNTLNNATQQAPKQQIKVMEKTTQNLIYQRRLQKLKRSIASTEQKDKKIQKDQKQQIAGMNFAKALGNAVTQGTIKQRTEAVEDILFKVQMNKDKPQFQAAVKAALPNILKLLKDPNPKIVGLTLKILQNVVHQLKSNDGQLQNLIAVVIQKLGDQKISIRQIVVKVVRELVNKTDKGVWIRELLQSIKKNDNVFLKDEALNIVINIFVQNQLENINFQIQELVEKLLALTDDPKTKIKIRALDCLAHVVAKSKETQRYNNKLKESLSNVFYQMYLEKVTKLLQQNERKNMLILQKRRKQQANNFRTTSQSYNNYRKQSSEDDPKMNVSLDIIKKRVNNLKSKRNALSTRETISLDRTYKGQQRNQGSNIEQDQISLPVLKPKVAGRRRFQGSPNRTIDNSKSGGNDYLSKEDLKPLSDPQGQFRMIMSELKSGDWKVQFQTTTKLRRVAEFHSQLIRNTGNANLHMIVLDLLGLVECLRSSVSKNALICLYEIIEAIGKQIDPENQIILQKLMKKSADTNIFISSQVQKCLNVLSLNATPGKLLQKLMVYKQSKNFAIKDSFISTLLVMKDDEKIRAKQYAKLSQIMTIFLNEGQVDLRSKAKNGIVEICTNLGDWYRLLRGKISATAFKQICDLMTKNSMTSISVPQPDTTPIVKLRKHGTTTSENGRSFTLQPKSEKEESGIKEDLKKSTRRSFIKVQQFPNQFSQIDGLIDLSTNNEWKKRIESVQGLKLLALKWPNQFVQYRSSAHFLDIISKQISEPNVKVSVIAMEVFLQIIEPLKRLVQNSLNVISNNLFNALSSSKVEVKQMAEKCTNVLINQIDMPLMLQHICHGTLYSLPKSRIYLLNKLEQFVQSIHNEKKQLLFKYVFPMLNRLMEEYKPQLMPHVVNFFTHLYQIMGNNMFSHLVKFKQVRDLIDK